jgi:hypothetical protein
VGEIDPYSGHVLTGYPDGQAAWLLDEDTIRVAYQSESYGTLSNETYPWIMDSGVKFTGSQIHAIDYNREAFADFLNNQTAASEMLEGAGHLFDTVYNAFGEIVTGKNFDSNDLAAKWGNQTGADGTVYEFDSGRELTLADWYFHSFCGAYYEQANKYGNGIGFEDDVWLMGEEWNIGSGLYASRGGNDFFTNNTMGLASMVVDIANEVAYTVPALGQSGYEKILPINPGNDDYVVLAMSGYNLEVEPAPLKIYIGKKDFDAKGNEITDYSALSERDQFLGRNGLLFGQLYGMAADDATYAALGITNVDADTEMLNAYATDADAPDTFSVRYYATSYQWDGFDTPENAGETEVYRWLEDGDGGEPNEQPTGYTFFNGDSKVEHPAVDPDPTKSRYAINLTDASTILGIDFRNILSDLQNDQDNNGLPDYLSADVTRIVAGVDGALTLQTNGKGLANQSSDLNPDGTLTHSIHVEKGEARLDQPDGLQWIKTADGDYLIVDEDSGNDGGERKMILPINANTLALRDPNTGYFLAAAGGSDNPRALAGVAAVPGTFSRATSSEFSGSWNVTPFVAKKADGSFYTQSEIAGTGAQNIIGNLPLDQQTFIGVVQHAGESGGLVADRLADQGGQIFMFNITEPLTPSNSIIAPVVPDPVVPDPFVGGISTDSSGNSVVNITTGGLFSFTISSNANSSACQDLIAIAIDGSATFSILSTLGNAAGTPQGFAFDFSATRTFNSTDYNFALRDSINGQLSFLTAVANGTGFELTGNGVRVTASTTAQPGITEELNLLGNTAEAISLDDLVNPGTGNPFTIQIDATLHREAAFNNQVGFYLANRQGDILDPLTGQVVAALNSDRATYLNGVINHAVFSGNVGNNATGAMADSTVAVSGAIDFSNAVLLPFIVIDNTLTGVNRATFEDLYVATLGLNADNGTDHVRLLGDNVFGFEDLANGGDNDFDDIIVKVNSINVV